MEIGRLVARTRHIVALVAACSVIQVAVGATAQPDRTPLDEYIAKPDATYSWKLSKTLPGDGYTTFVVDMKSQTWRTSPEVNRPLWQHWVTIVKPNEVKYDTAFLLIGGGSNGRPAPDKPDAMTLAFARTTNSVAVELTMIP